MAGQLKAVYFLMSSVYLTATLFVLTADNRRYFAANPTPGTSDEVSRRSAHRVLLSGESGGTRMRSLDDDMLLPYSSYDQWPRSNLSHVRDCQPVIFGDTTHETFPGHENSSVTSSSTTRYFVTKLADFRGNVKDAYGHYTVINNPLKTFSVVEPGGPNGCIDRRRSTVVKTSKVRGCRAAVNAGFFDSETGACLGNVVADGRRVQDSGGIQNVNFGIRKDGTIVVGYLSELDVLQEDNPFVQLVTGVIWLVRNGTVYVNESKLTECAGLQEYGTMDKFVDVVSARSAVGHDAEGRVVLVHIDGNTEERGVSLWEFAEYLQSLGVVNAINLDGGGSVTLVLDGGIANYPADHCADNQTWHCARKVSTVLCAHDPDGATSNCRVVNMHTSLEVLLLCTIVGWFLQ